MQRIKRAWFRVPGRVRKPITLVVGICFVFASLLLGWLPGIGGIPLFIIGVTILATEYEWATRFRDFSLNKLKEIAAWYRKNKVLGTIICFIGLAFALAGIYVFYTQIF